MAVMTTVDTCVYDAGSRHVSRVSRSTRHFIAAIAAEFVETDVNYCAKFQRPPRKMYHHLVFTAAPETEADICNAVCV